MLCIQAIIVHVGTNLTARYTLILLYLVDSVIGSVIHASDPVQQHDCTFHVLHSLIMHLCLCLYEMLSHICPAV